MNTLNKYSINIILLVAALFLFSCKSNTGSKEDKEGFGQNVQVIVEAENYNDSSGNFKEIARDKNKIFTKAETEGWLAYDLKLPVAGRYRISVYAAPADTSCSSVWIEDYYDNKDGRTYNITGTLDCISYDISEKEPLCSVDGSPLNKGMHRIKLHITSGGLYIDKIVFDLIAEHRPSVKTLTQNMKGSEWEIVWADEFEGTGLPDTTKWVYDIGNWGWGNFELQYYTEGREENARLEDGCLVIEARKDDMNQKWTSARLTTRGKTSFVYGKIEFRAKVPTEKGNWAAGWTLGDSYVDELSWPYCGEIDILESVGFEIDDATGDGKAHASIHCGAYYFKLNNQPTAVMDVSSMNTEFHTYAVEWYPDRIEAYVDDILYMTYNDTSDDLAWPFSSPQNIILNLAMGGGWGGAHGMDENVTSQKFIVDYVRVYQLK